MVYITPEQYDEAYQKIVDDAVGRHGSVLILVSADPDALCALKVLLTLLKDDSVTYHMIPVAGYDDLRRVNRVWFHGGARTHGSGTVQGPTNPELRSVICLNCGGTADLAELFDIPELVTFYVIDCHRPFYLYNLFSHPQIIVFDDGETDEGLEIVKQAFFRLENGAPAPAEALRESGPPKRSRSPGSQSDEEVDDGEGSDTGRSPPARRRRTGTDSDVAAGPGAADGDEPLNPDGDTNEVDPDRVDLSDLSPGACRHIIAEYYEQGHYAGQSTAVTLYMLSLQLSRENPDMLWYAIVGLTHQFIFEQIDEEDYWSQVQVYTDEVERVFPALVHPDNGTSDSGLDLTQFGGGDILLGGDSKKTDQDTMEGGTMSRTSTEVALPVEDTAAPSSSSSLNMHVKRVTQPNGIRYSEEFKFMLLRHWSLYNSMHYSRYLSTRLGIWSDRGRRLLSLMLAKMGFSLSDAHQIYIHMSPENKTRLRTKLDQVAPDYGCDDLVFPSFVRSFGWRKGSQLSASDVVHSLVALLKGAGTQDIASFHDGQARAAAMNGGAPGSAPPSAGNESQSDWQGIVPWRAAPDGPSGDVLAPPTKSEQDTAWLQGFYTAYDSLGDLDLIQSGIQLAMKFQRAIVQQGISIIERRSVKTLKSFRLAVLTDNQPLFHHPLTLTQLVMFLADATQNHQSHKRSASLPFVIASFNPIKNTYLVVGLLGDTHGPNKKSSSDTPGDHHNPFGVAFQKTAERTGARTKHDSFESSVVEIVGPDLSNFVEYLHLYL
ncbi:DNA replication initiation factor cdc45 [Dimargaris cristalligena]|nr:DNA replication initiation factor cdc45 [Dimargaris cristalligena]